MADPTPVDVPIKGSATYEFTSTEAGNVGPIQINFNISVAAAGQSVAVEMLYATESMGSGTLTAKSPSANFMNEFLETPMLMATLTADFQTEQLSYSLTCTSPDLSETWTGSVTAWSAEYARETIQPEIVTFGPGVTVSVD